MVAPFIPKLEFEEDTQNFDKFEEKQKWFDFQSHLN